MRPMDEGGFSPVTPKPRAVNRAGNPYGMFTPGPTVSRSKPRPKLPYTPLRSYTPPRSSGSSGGGGGYVARAPSRPVGSSSTGAVRPTAPPAAPKPPPGPPSINSFLAGDTTYAGQQSALKKAMADYLAQFNQQTGQYNTDYTLNTSNMGRQRKVAGSDLENDYASRGLLTSGVYGKAASDLQTDYDKRQAELNNAKANFLANLTTGKQNFSSDQALQSQKARQDAINRRAAQYSI